MPDVSAQIEVVPFSFTRSFALQALGHYDPTATVGETSLRKTFAAANGPCTVVIEAILGGVRVDCSGADAEAVLAELLASFAADDGCGSFAPEHDLLKKLHREQAGLRLLRVPWLFDVACGAVLQQRVRFLDAMRDWRHVTERHGTRDATGAPVFPAPRELARVPVFALEAMGIDVKRGRTLVALARELTMNPLRAAMTYTQLRGRLGRVPGVGPWTVETTLGFGAGDADALPLGDLYLPHLVAFALAGEPQATDERMTELLEPCRGHRFRAVRLLYGAQISPPRVSRAAARRVQTEREHRW